MRRSLHSLSAGAILALAVMVLVLASGGPDFRASARIYAAGVGPYRAFLPVIERATLYPPPVMLQRLAAAEAHYPAIRGQSADSCLLCHAGQPPAANHQPGQYNLNNYGGDFRDFNYNFGDAGLERIDSDGDNFRNGDELRAGSNPGEAGSQPGTGPTPPPPPPTVPPPPPTSGTTFYVATNGNNDNPGSEARPWRTIDRAAQALNAGDVVLIRAGTYRERLVPARSGSAGNYITYMAYPGETVTLDGAGISINNSQGIVELSSRSHIRVSGLNVRNCLGVCLFADRNADDLIIDHNNTTNSGSSGIGIWNSTHVTVDHNDVATSCTNGANEAITFSGVGGFEVKNNHVHNEGLPSGNIGKEGINVKGGSHDGTVHHNNVDNMQKVAVYVDAYDRHTYNIEMYSNLVHDTKMGVTLASERGGLLENVRVYNNVIWDVVHAGIATFGQVETTSHPMQAIQYINNTIYNTNPGINVGNTQVSNFVVRNNLVTMSGNSRPFDFIAGSPVTADHNLTGDPLYVDPAGGNFHVQASSPAINAGSSAGAPPVDMDGVPRPQAGAFDIGAYER